MGHGPTMYHRSQDRPHILVLTSMTAASNSSPIRPKFTIAAIGDVVHPPAGQQFICSPGLSANFTPDESAASEKIYYYIVCRQICSRQKLTTGPLLGMASPYSSYAMMTRQTGRRLLQRYIGLTARCFASPVQLT